MDELGWVLAFFLLKETGLNDEEIAAAIAEIPRSEYFSLGE